MKFIKKIMQITLLLFMSLTLNIIAWAPSLVVENIVNFIIIILYIIAVILVYQTMKEKYAHQANNSIWRNIFYTIFLLTYIGLFAILLIGISYSKSSYVKQYTFDEKLFYIYQNTDLTYEVSVKESSLPIRSLPIASFSDTPINLKKEDKYLYVTGEGIHEKIYDFEKNISIKDLKNKEKND